MKSCLCLAEYSPRINAQQLKNALISQGRARTGREADRGARQTFRRQSVRGDGAGGELPGCGTGKNCGALSARLPALSSRFAAAGGPEFGSGQRNLIGNRKLRELSAMNGTLYEFLLPEEQKPAEDKVLTACDSQSRYPGFVAADQLSAGAGLNPASYFSLNFYDPVNKLLAKYGATQSLYRRRCRHPRPVRTRGRGASWR